MKCYYHNDLDGKCAAAIVFRGAGVKPEGKKHRLQLIEMDYNREIDLRSIEQNERIWIVDFSFKPEVMEEILKVTQDIIWIDHHKTAMEYKYSIDLPGIRDVSLSGCELTWRYVYPNITMPKIVHMLGRYDVWDFSEYGEDLNKLQAGIKLHNTDPANYEWVDWLDSSLETMVDLLNEGNTALQYRNNYYTDLIKAAVFFFDFEGHKVVACNAGLVSSQLFDSVQEEFDIMMPFYFAKNKWIVSLYTTKDIDVSEIAKKYGGGGHKQAAGFTCEELPFLHQLRHES